jgi:hypothetical protein
MGQQAVAFPADAAITWTLARPAWLTRLKGRAILDKLAEEDGLRRLWVAGYRVEDADERVLFAYEGDEGSAARRLADTVYRAASELRRCYQGVAATVSAVPEEGRAWLARQPPVIG